MPAKPFNEMTDPQRLERAHLLYTTHRTNIRQTDSHADDLACLAFAIITYGQMPVSTERGAIISAYLRVAFLMGKATAQPVIDAAVQWYNNTVFNTDHLLADAVMEYLSKEQQP